MYKFILLVWCIVGVTVAYDFSDSQYNEYLIQDLIDIADTTDDFEGYVPVRSRRHTADESEKCKSKHRGLTFSKCCNDNADSYKHLDKIKEIKKECYAEVVRDATDKDEDEHHLDMFSCEKIEKKKEDFKCIAKCVGEKLNVMDKNGEFIEKALREHVKNDLAVAPWQKEISDHVVDVCLTEVRNAHKKTKRDTAVLPVTGTTKKCGSSGIKFGYCIWKEFVKSCPKEMHSDSEKCKSLRGKLEKGEKIDFLALHFQYHH